MKLLLDTHLILCVAGISNRLSIETKMLLEDTQNLLLFSAASLWEITIKNGLGRADFKVDTHILRRELCENGYKELAITSNHAVFINDLPLIHKDPFDRILISQAIVEGITLLTSDKLIAQYPGPIRLV